MTITHAIYMQPNMLPFPLPSISWIALSRPNSRIIGVLADDDFTLFVEPGNEKRFCKGEKGLYKVIKVCEQSIIKRT